MKKPPFAIFFDFLCVLFLLLPQAAQAQDIPRGNLYNLKTASFPVFKVSVDVYDASGNLITGLTRSDFTILEDGLERPLDAVDIIDPGLEFVAAINPGFSFSILDDQARSRYDKVAAELSHLGREITRHRQQCLQPGNSRRTKRLPCQ